MNWASVVDRTAAPLDGVRRWGLSWVARHIGLSWLVSSRERRIQLMATIHVVTALALAAFFPVILFLLGPVVLGVAHVAADVRYLVARRSLAPWWLRVVLTACLTLVALRMFLPVSRATGFKLEVLLVTAWALVAVVAGMQRRARAGTFLRPGLTLCLVLTLGSGAWVWSTAFQIWLVHLHNWVGWGAWLLLFRSRVSSVWLPAILTLVGAALLGSGWTTSFTLTSGAESLGMHLFEAAESVAPGLHAEQALGLTCMYVFMQSIHYGVWLYYIPQEELPGQAPLTFRRTFRSLYQDLGESGLWMLILGIVAVAASSVWGLRYARGMYLELATFHVYLELVMCTYFWTAGGLHKRAQEYAGGRVPS